MDPAEGFGFYDFNLHFPLRFMPRNPLTTTQTVKNINPNNFPINNNQEHYDQNLKSIQHQRKDSQSPFNQNQTQNLLTYRI